MAQQQAIRDYLKSRGLKDEEVGYDNGTVLAKGKRFIDATPQADGRTYADTKSLDNAYNDYDTRNQIAQLQTRATTPNSELTNLQQAIKARINKPVQQFSYDQNTDPQYQNAIKQAQQNAQTAGNNAMVALGARGIGNSSITSDRVAQIQQKELGNVTANVLPQLISQAYQRFQGQQQAENNQTGQLMQLANMYDNQDQQQYARLAQALGLQNNYNQQQFTNERAMTQEQRQAQQDHLALANQLSQQYGVNVDPKEDPALAYEQVRGLTPLAVQQYLANREDAKFQQGIQEAGVRGTYQGEPTLAARNQAFNQGIEQQRLGLSAAGQGQSASNARINQLLDIYRATGQAPSGLEGYGVQPGTSYYNPSNPQNAPKIDAKQSADAYSMVVEDLGTAGVSKDQANQLADANKAYLTDADYKKLKSYIDKNF